MDGKPKRAFGAFLLSIASIFGLILSCAPKQVPENERIPKVLRLTVEGIPCPYGSRICPEIICDLKHNEEYIAIHYGQYQGGIVKTGHKCN